MLCAVIHTCFARGGFCVEKCVSEEEEDQNGSDWGKQEKVNFTVSQTTSVWKILNYP